MIDHSLNRVMSLVEIPRRSSMKVVIKSSFGRISTLILGMGGEWRDVVQLELEWH